MEGFTIIIPVYNEEKIIVKNTKKLISFLDKFKSRYEIILCDNGSNDSTRNKGLKLQKKFPNKVRFISIAKRGVGLAFKEAVLASNYNNLISIDMDLSIDLNFILECLNLLRSHSVVVGSKILGSQKRLWYRKLLSNGFIFLSKLLLGLDFTDYSIGAKGYKKKDIIDRIECIDQGSFYVLNLVYYVKQKGKKIIEIPTLCYDTRKSKFNLCHEAIYRGIKLLSFWFREKILNRIIPTPI